MKTSGVRPIAETPPQTMTELGFCTLWTNLCSSRMAEAEVDNILSFWRFEASSTVNNFSSENKTFSSPWLANRVNSPLLLDSLFARILSVRKWTRFLLKEDSPKSLFTILLRDPRDVFSSSAIFLTDLRGFRQTRLLTASFISLVVAVTGRTGTGFIWQATCLSETSRFIPAGWGSCYTAKVPKSGYSGLHSELRVATFQCQPLCSVVLVHYWNNSNTWHWISPSPSRNFKKYNS